MTTEEQALRYKAAHAPDKLTLGEVRRYLALKEEQVEHDEWPSDLRESVQDGHDRLADAVLRPTGDELLEEAEGLLEDMTAEYQTNFHLCEQLRLLLQTVKLVRGVKEEQS